MLLPLVTIVPSVISRITILMVWHNLDSFWQYNGLISTVFGPWLSVANPLVTILFVERYRRFMGEILHGILMRIGVIATTSNRILPSETGFLAVRAAKQEINRRNII